MIQYEPGDLAKSLMGHDKGHLYVISDVSKEYVSLTDGKTRTISRPKRKKKKHVQLQYSQDERLKHRLKQREAVSDEEIRELLQQQGGNKRNVKGRRD